MTGETDGSNPHRGYSERDDLPQWGVVLIAHGSQRGQDRSECSCAWDGSGSQPPQWCLNCPSTPRGLTQAAQQLQSILGLGTHQVVLSCLEFIEPFPQEAVKLLRDRGLTQVALVPFLLGSGKHATLEMEEILGELRLGAPEMQLHLVEGLGTDPLLAELVAQRVQDMNGDWDSARDGDPKTQECSGIVLVKAGTKTMYDDCLWLADLGRLVERRLGPGYAVEVAQSHYGDPTMEAATETLVENRGVSSLTYVPYLFSPGLILKRNVLGTMSQLRETYPFLPMRVTPPLGADGPAIAVAAQRVRQLWARV